MFNRESIEKIKEHLVAKKQTLAVAESATAGFLQAAFASAERASEYFEGGITVYNIDQKVRHLHIDRQKGEATNCVSADTANEMAKGVCRLFQCDWGVSITGYATPVPESDFKLFAFFSICKGKEIVYTNRISLHDKQPLEAQLIYVNNIVDNFQQVLENL
jgi:PncC family amidohydrolase